KNTDLKKLKLDLKSDAHFPHLLISTWDEMGSINHVKQYEVQRNITVLVMILIQLQCVFIMYAVFSTLVSEKRQDIGVLLGIGARPSQIRNTFLLTAVFISSNAAICGCLLGWTVLAVLNPICEITGFQLFPQGIIYTPDTPVSWNYQYPALFSVIIIICGVLAAVWPAHKASSIKPIETLREY
ncbi:MAG: FtsX-like permease family protein, partial [Planctomycetes bacterium]|nr:FtsX-like permease family protein [Planctomycetota bacterium]